MFLNETNRFRIQLFEEHTSEDKQVHLFNGCLTLSLDGFYV